LFNVTVVPINPKYRKPLVRSLLIVTVHDACIPMPRQGKQATK
jgi:hypothetical protein